ncbi:kelch domain-containing protein 8B-like [Engraulis encrasicolus]|uniref:kelch domain-containing protein 8B-like n=1 Tax=Engraulis encrasicolus TaxID=184585 RepID=UPI002FD4323C
MAPQGSSAAGRYHAQGTSVMEENGGEHWLITPPTNLAGLESNRRPTPQPLTHDCPVPAHAHTLGLLLITTPQRPALGALEWGGQLVVMGGMDAQQSPLASVEAYCIDEGRWERKAGLGQPSMGITAVEKDGRVYALGGMGADTSPQALVRVYEPAKDQWLPLATMPTPRYGAASFLRGSRSTCWVFG